MSKVTFSVKKGGLGGLAAALLRAPASAPAPAAAPAPAPSLGGSDAAREDGEGHDAEHDPLEAFMAEIETTVQTQATVRGAQPQAQAVDGGNGLESSEAGEGYDRNLDAGGLDDDDDDDAMHAAEDGGLVYDSDGEVIGVRKAGSSKADKDAPPLPPVDHSTIQYEPFRRSFYTPQAASSAAEVSALRSELNIVVAETAGGGRDAPAPAPVQSFMHLGLDRSHPVLIAALAAAGYEAPTPIQAQALPCLLAGRDVLGLAQTGSGKTLAYVLPLVRHCIEQRELEAGEGPIGLILAPTRELATQIAAEAKRFAKPLGLTVALLTGGSSKWQQAQVLRGGAEVVVATPGRLVDHLTGSDRSTSLRRVTFLVLDEADRMLDMGFSQQVRSITDCVRPDRQAALFSATLPPKIQALADAALRDPVLITVGCLGAAASGVEQRVVVLGQGAKWGWLQGAIRGLLARGKVLVFVSQRAAADELCASLNGLPAVHQAVGDGEAQVAAAGLQLGASTEQRPSHPTPPSARRLPTTGVVALSLHGDKHQSDRDQVIARFKASGPAPAVPILVATDVASRGLDIAGVGTVVCYDAARDIHTHVHRVGRTGRMGPDGTPVPGLAVALLQPTEGAFGCELVRSMRAGGVAPPQELVQLARPHPRFGWAMAPLSTSSSSSTASSSSSLAAAGYTRKDGAWVATDASAGGRSSRGGGGGGKGKWGQGSTAGASSAFAPGLGYGARADAADADEDSGETSHLWPFHAGSGAAPGLAQQPLLHHTQYQPPLPGHLEPGPLTPGETSSVSNASAAAAAPAVSAIDRSVAVARAAAAAAIASAAATGGPIAPAAEYMGAGEALALQDGNDVQDVDVDGDDEDEQTNLRRRRKGRFGSRFDGQGDPPSASSTASGSTSGSSRASALHDLRSVAHARLASSFAASFVSAGGEGSSSSSSSSSSAGSISSSAGHAAAFASSSNADPSVAGGTPHPQSAPSVASNPPPPSASEGSGVGAGAVAEPAPRKRSRWGPPVPAAVLASGESLAGAAAAGLPSLPVGPSLGASQPTRGRIFY